LSEIDPGQASERYAREIQLRRLRNLAVLAGTILALAAAGYGYWSRRDLAAHYVERFHSIAADVHSVERGALSDASALCEALDDIEARTALNGQAPVWEDRVLKCAALRRKLASLVPQSPGEASKLRLLEERLQRLEQVSIEIARASQRSDPAHARRAAGGLLGSNRSAAVKE
jgi:hypothetical protein